MKFLVSVWLMAALWLAGLGLAQDASVVCTREMSSSDDCADVIDPNACYNEYRFNSMRTLSCIAGKDDTDRARKVCKCCSCVGAQLCNWAATNRLCSGGGGAAAGSPPAAKKKGRGPGRRWPPADV